MHEIFCLCSILLLHVFLKILLEEVDCFALREFSKISDAFAGKDGYF